MSVYLTYFTAGGAEKSFGSSYEAKFFDLCQTFARARRHLTPKVSSTFEMMQYRGDYHQGKGVYSGRLFNLNHHLQTYVTSDSKIKFRSPGASIFRYKLMKNDSTSK